jgi:hypothetical protein
MYLGVAYITHATQGFYVYSFLNPSKGSILAAYIIGILAGTVLVFSIVNLIKLGLSKWNHTKNLNNLRDRVEMGQHDRAVIMEESKLSSSV